MSKVPVFWMSVTNFKSVFKDALDFLEEVFNFYLTGGRALIPFMLSLIRNQERQIVAPSNFCHKNNFFALVYLLSGVFTFAFLSGSAPFLMKNNSLWVRLPVLQSM